MKEVKILHLYYDLMNLYGETGNIEALKEAFKRQNIKATVSYLTKGDKINFNDYDIFYMGMGTEKNQEIVRNDILRYKTEIKKIINKKIFIMTGNSYELFGKTINKLPCLGIFNFKSRTVKNRIVKEQVNKTYLIEDKIIGFQNRSSINDNEENHLFEVINGNTDNKKSKFEGIHINKFYGTYTIGPLLIRNPSLLDKIVKNYCEEHKYPYKEIKDTYEYKAYYEYLKNFNIK